MRLLLLCTLLVVVHHGNAEGPSERVFGKSVDDIVNSLGEDGARSLAHQLLAKVKGRLGDSLQPANCKVEGEVSTLISELVEQEVASVKKATVNNANKKKQCLHNGYFFGMGSYQANLEYGNRGYPQREVAFMGNQHGTKEAGQGYECNGWLSEAQRKLFKSANLPSWFDKPPDCFPKGKINSMPSMACKSVSCLKSKGKGCKKGCYDGEMLSLGKHNRALQAKYPKLHLMSSTALMQSIRWTIHQFLPALQNVHGALCNKSYCKAGGFAQKREATRSSSSSRRILSTSADDSKWFGGFNMEKVTKKAQKLKEMVSKGNVEKALKKGKRAAAKLKAKLKAKARAKMLQMKALARKKGAEGKRKLHKKTQEMKGKMSSRANNLRRKLKKAAGDMVRKKIVNEILRVVIKSKPKWGPLLRPVGMWVAGGMKMGKPLGCALAPPMRTKLNGQMDIRQNLCYPWNPILNPAYATRLNNKYGVGQLIRNTFLGRKVKSQDKHYGDAAFEVFKCKLSDFGGSSVQAEKKCNYKKAKCAARFQTNIKICTTCCCREGLVRSDSTGRLTKKAGPDFECESWFNIIDTTIRFYNNLQSVFSVYGWHTAVKKAGGTGKYSTQSTECMGALVPDKFERGQTEGKGRMAKGLVNRTKINMQ